MVLVEAVFFTWEEIPTERAEEDEEDDNEPEEGEEGVEGAAPAESLL